MAPAAVARAEVLRREVAGHKKAIATHRKLLRVAAADLRAAERVVAALGFGVYTEVGGGATRGRSGDDTDPQSGHPVRDDGDHV